MSNKILFIDPSMPKTEWKKFWQDLKDKGYVIYFTRHGDEGDWCTPVSVKECPVFVNRCGWAITERALDFSPDLWTKNLGMKEIIMEDALAQVDINIGHESGQLDITNFDIANVEQVDILFQEGVDAYEATR